jgi:hypothetical protein
MGKKHKSQGEGSRNSDRNSGKAKKKNAKSGQEGNTKRSRGGYNIEKRPDKASSWNAVKKRIATKAKRKALGLAIAHGIRTGQLTKIKANADS